MRFVFFYNAIFESFLLLIHDEFVILICFRERQNIAISVDFLYIFSVRVNQLYRVVGAVGVRQGCRLC